MRAHFLDCPSDGTSHVDAGALGARRRASIPAAESNRATELARQKRDFLLHRSGTIRVATRFGLIKTFAQFLKSPPVGLFGTGVEHFARIPRAVRMQSGVREFFVADRGTFARPQTNSLEGFTPSLQLICMELSTRISQQLRDISQAP